MQVNIQPKAFQAEKSEASAMAGQLFRQRKVTHPEKTRARERELVVTEEFKGTGMKGPRAPTSASGQRICGGKVRQLVGGWQ